MFARPKTVKEIREISKVSSWQDFGSAEGLPRLRRRAIYANFFPIAANGLVHPQALRTFVDGMTRSGRQI